MYGKIFKAKDAWEEDATNAKKRHPGELRRAPLASFAVNVFGASDRGRSTAGLLNIG
jgi:hypothetical protein